MPTPAFITDWLAERLDVDTARITWTGSTNAVVRAWRDGVLILGPFTIAAAGKTIDFGFPADDAHEIDITEDVSNTDTPLVIRRPNLRWHDKINTAEFFRVYHQEGEGGADAALADVARAPDGDGWYDFIVPSDLNGAGGVWHFFRVEAIDSNGLGTTTAQWAALIRGPKAGPSNLVVTQTAQNVVTLTITE